MNDPATTPSTTDPATPADPVAALDELIAKAKAKRASIAEQRVTNQSVPAEDAGVATVSEGPSPEEVEAQKLAELAAKEAAAEEENQRLLLQHQEKMQNLSATPQYQARKSQEEAAAQELQEQQAAQQGHVIHQIGDAKV